MSDTCWGTGGGKPPSGGSAVETPSEAYHYRWETIQYLLDGLEARLAKRIEDQTERILTQMAENQQQFDAQEQQVATDVEAFVSLTGTLSTIVGTLVTALKNAGTPIDLTSEGNILAQIDQAAANASPSVQQAIANAQAALSGATPDAPAS